MSTYYWVGRTLTMSLAHAVWRPTILGKDNVPKEGGVLLASNHLSFIDSFAIPVAAPRKVSFLAKQEYFTGTGIRGRFVRGFMEAGDAIPLDRDDSRGAQASLDLVLRRLGGPAAGNADHAPMVVVLDPLRGELRRLPGLPGAEAIAAAVEAALAARAQA